MVFRKAKKGDNFNKIAELIYQTDKYIYPFWFQDYPNWKEILVYLINQKGALFYYKNILVCEDRGEIVGILVYISENTDLDFKYTKLMRINPNFNYTIQTYIMPIVNQIKENVVCIPNISVDVFSRRKK